MVPPERAIPRRLPLAVTAAVVVACGMAVAVIASRDARATVPLSVVATGVAEADGPLGADLERRFLAGLERSAGVRVAPAADAAARLSATIARAPDGVRITAALTWADASRPPWRAVIVLAPVEIEDAARELVANVTRLVTSPDEAASRGPSRTITVERGPDGAVETGGGAGR
jgi:hypothetical protein